MRTPTSLPRPSAPPSASIAGPSLTAFHDPVTLYSYSSPFTRMSRDGCQPFPASIFAVPERSRAAERLSAVGVHGFVLRRPAVGHRIHGGLGDKRVAARDSLRDGDAGSPFDALLRFRREDARGPLCRVVNDEHLDDA